MALEKTVILAFVGALEGWENTGGLVVCDCEVVDWLIEQCFTSPPTQYRLYGRRFLQVKGPNQQYQSTEGESCKGKQHKKHKENTNYTYAHTHKIVDEYSIQE